MYTRSPRLVVEKRAVTVLATCSAAAQQAPFPSSSSFSRRVDPFAPAHWAHVLGGLIRVDNMSPPPHLSVFLKAKCSPTELFSTPPQCSPQRKAFDSIESHGHVFQVPALQQERMMAALGNRVTVRWAGVRTVSVECRTHRV